MTPHTSVRILLVPNPVSGGWQPTLATRGDGFKLIPGNKVFTSRRGEPGENNTGLGMESPLAKGGRPIPRRRDTEAPPPRHLRSGRSGAAGTLPGFLGFKNDLHRQLPVSLSRRQIAQIPHAPGPKRLVGSSFRSAIPSELPQIPATVLALLWPELCSASALSVLEMGVVLVWHIIGRG